MADCQADESGYEPVTCDVLLTAVTFVLELLREGKQATAIQILEAAGDRLATDIAVANRQADVPLTLH